MVFEIRKGPREIRIWIMMNNNSQFLFLKWIFRRCVGGIIQSVQQRVRIRLLKKQRRSICHVTSGIKQSITRNRLVLHYSRSVKRCYGFQPIGATRCYALLYNNWGVFCKVWRVPKRYKIDNSNSPIRSDLLESHFWLANSNRQFYIFLERVRLYIHWLSELMGSLGWKPLLSKAIYDRAVHLLSPSPSTDCVNRSPDQRTW